MYTQLIQGLQHLVNGQQQQTTSLIQQQQVLDWFVQLTMALKYLHERFVFADA